MTDDEANISTVSNTKRNDFMKKFSVGILIIIQQNDEGADFNGFRCISNYFRANIGTPPEEGVPICCVCLFADAVKLVLHRAGKVFLATQTLSRQEFLQAGFQNLSQLKL